MARRRVGPPLPLGLLSPTRSPKLSWRWLLLAAAILAIIAGGAGLLALQRGKADAPDARRDLQQWTKVSDFRPDLTSRLNRTPMYPERIEARCENGVSQRRVARWLPLQEGQDFVRYYTPEEDFASFEADQVAKGFKKTFDTCFSRLRWVNGSYFGMDEIAVTRPGKNIRGRSRSCCLARAAAPVSNRRSCVRLSTGNGPP